MGGSRSRGRGGGWRVVVEEIQNTIHRRRVIVGTHGKVVGNVVFERLVTLYVSATKHERSTEFVTGGIGGNLPLGGSGGRNQDAIGSKLLSVRTGK